MGIVTDALTQYVTDMNRDAAEAKSGKSSTRRELEAAGIDVYGDTVRALGVVSGSSYLNDVADDADKASSRRRANSDYVQSWDDVDGVGSGASYLTRLGINTVPYIASMVVGGEAGAIYGGARRLRAADKAITASRAATAAPRARFVSDRVVERASATELEALAANSRSVREVGAGAATGRDAAYKALERSTTAGRYTGALAGTELSSIGSKFESQLDQSGEVDILSAGVLGTADNLLNLAGVEGQAVRGLPRALAGSRASRAAAVAARVGAEEGGAEVLQQGTEELARQSVDPDYDILNEGALKRYKESAIGGALLGGVVGGAEGALRKAPQDAKPRTLRDVLDKDAAVRNAEREVVNPRSEIAGLEAPVALGKAPFKPIGPTEPQTVDNLFTFDSPDTAGFVDKEAISKRLDAAWGRKPVNFDAGVKRQVLGAIISQDLTDARKHIADETKRTKQLAAKVEANLAVGDDIKAKVQERGIAGRFSMLSEATKILDAYESRLERVTRPEGAEPNIGRDRVEPIDVNAAAALARGQPPRPGARVTLPDPGSTSELQAREQNDAATQEAAGRANVAQVERDAQETAKSYREAVIADAMAEASEGRISEPRSHLYKKLLKIKSAPTKEENEALFAASEDYKARKTQADTAAAMTKMRDSLVEAPPKDTQDTTLGVRERAPKAAPELELKPISDKPLGKDQAEMFQERSLMPQGGTSLRKYVVEQMERANTFPENLADAGTARKSTQGELFRKDGKPTVAAAKANIASRMQNAIIKEIERLAERPGVDPDKISKMLDDVEKNKLGKARKSLEDEQTRVHKILQASEAAAPKVLSVREKQEAAIREQLAAHVRKYGNVDGNGLSFVGGNLPDIVDARISEGDFDSAERAIERDAIRIDNKIDIPEFSVKAKRAAPPIKEKAKKAPQGAAAKGAEVEITRRNKELPLESWGPKFQKQISEEYEIAVAGEDYTTQYDILSARYNNDKNIPADQKAAIGKELSRLKDLMGPESRSALGISEGDFDSAERTIERDNAPIVPKDSLEPSSFVTAKGSTYLVNADGSTTRTKAARDDVGHEGDSGRKPKSEATYYVDDAAANQLSLFQAENAAGKMSVVKASPDTVGIKYLDGKDEGKFERRTVVKFSKTPAVGLTPVETWRGGTSVHFGNKIVQVGSAKGGPGVVALVSPKPAHIPVSTLNDIVVTSLGRGQLDMETAASLLRRIHSGDEASIVEAEAELTAPRTKPDTVANLKTDPAKKAADQSTPDAVKNPDDFGYPLSTQEKPGDGKPEFEPNTPEGRERINDAKSQVYDLVRDWTNLPKVEIFDSRAPATDIQRNIVGRLAGGDAIVGRGTKGAFIYVNGVPHIAIMVDQIENPADLTTTLYHELLGHYGLRDAYGKGMERVTRDLYYTTPDFQAEVKALLDEYGWPPNDVSPIRFYGEEVLAMQAEKGVINQGVLSRVLAAIRQFGRRIGFVKSAYTNDEVASILRRGQQRVINGKGPGQLAKNPKGALYAYARSRGDKAVTKFGPQAKVPSTTRRAEIRSKMQRFGAPEAMISFAITADSLARKNFQGMLFGTDLADFARPLMPGTYDTYHGLLQTMDSVITKHTKQLDQMLVDAYAAKSADGRSLTEDVRKYLKAATLGKEWGYAPTWLKEAPVIDPKARDLYNKQDPKVREIADGIFKYGHDTRTELQEVASSFVNEDTAEDLKKLGMNPQQIKDTLAATPKGIADAELIKLGMTRAQLDEVTGRRAHQLKVLSNSIPKLSGPYAPLMRFGNFVTAGRSAALKALEEKVDKTGKDLTTIDEMRNDEKHYEVHFSDSMGKAEQIEQVLKKRGFDDVYATPKQEFYNKLGDSPLFAMQKLKTVVTSELGKTDVFNKETVAKIETMLKDLYIASIAETSARKHDLRREGVAGASDDMLRSLNSKGRADAHFLSQLKNRVPLNVLLQEMSEQAKIKDDRTAERQLLMNEVTMRHVASMEFEDTPWQDKAMAISSFMHLATSPRYYLQNLTQTPMYSIPVMAAKYGGLGAAWKETLDAYKIFRNVTKNGKEILDFVNGKLDLDLLDVTPDERAMLTEMRDRNVIDIGMLFESGHWNATTTSGRKLSEITHWFRTKSAQAEVVNRASAGVATYRMARKKGETHEQATKSAINLVTQTHGLYTKGNAPRHFNSLPKFVTQFRKYQLIQLSLLGRNVFNAFSKTSDPQEKLVARKTLAYLLGQVTVMTGAIGLPGAQLVGVILSAAFGDDDQPLDGEKWMMDAAGNSDVGKMLLRGLPTIGGLELPGLGLGTVLNPFPYMDYKDLDTPRGVAEGALAVMGPIGGVAQKFSRAAGDLLNGDATKVPTWVSAATEAAPSGVRDALRAYELATKGLTKNNGDTLMTPDEITFAEIVMQSLGFQPGTVSDARRLASQAREFEEYFKGRTSEMKYAYTQAVKAGDREAASEVQETWKRVQAAKKAAGFKPDPLSSLLKAVAEQRKREKNTKGGVQFNSRNRGFVEAGAGG